MLPDLLRWWARQMLEFVLDAKTPNGPAAQDTADAVGDLLRRHSDIHERMLVNAQAREPLERGRAYAYLAEEALRLCGDYSAALAQMQAERDLARLRSAGGPPEPKKKDLGT